MFQRTAARLIPARLRRTSLLPCPATGRQRMIPLVRRDLQHMSRRPHPDIGRPPRIVHGVYAGLSNTR